MKRFTHHNYPSAISPTVGVILMVAITVGLATVVGITVFGLGDQVSNNTGTVGLDSSQVESEYTITAQSGQFDSFEYVYVTSTSTVTYSGGIEVSGKTYSNGPDNSSQYLYDGDSGGAGTSVTVNTSTASDAGQIQVIGVANDNEKVLQSYSILTSTVSSFQTAPNELPEIHSNMNGNGTTQNPYEISNIYELQAVQDNVTANYIVVNDIDASGTANWNIESGGTGFTPIGNQSDNFTGTIDGNNHTINSLYINQNQDNIGLFKYFSGNISQLNIQNATVSGNENVGTLIGTLSGNENAAVSNITTTGTVTGNKYIGGIIGVNPPRNTHKIQNLHSNTSVTGNGTVGGIIGLSSSPITNTSANATVTLRNGDGQAVGGIAGQTFSTVANSYTTGTIYGYGKDTIGGLIGITSRNAVIIQSYSSANITSSMDSSGGLVGINSEGDIIGSFATGDITVNGEQTFGAGGLVGNNQDYISSSYTTGSVTTDGDAAGGIAGLNQGTINATYTTTTVSAKNDSGGFVGIHPSYAKTINSYWNKTASNQSQASAIGSSNVSEISLNELTGPNALSNMTGFNTTIWTATDNYPQLKWKTKK